MTNAFARMKALSQSNKDVEILAKEMAKAYEQKYASDERFWYPQTDKTGNGSAVIRFLPAIEGEPSPYVQYFHHHFKGPTGQWYSEFSRTSLGRGNNDPVAEYNSALWNSGVEADKEIARRQKRKLTFVSNIYVVKDPQNPENEGKVFLFRYGKKIFDKINHYLNPSIAGVKPSNPFDFWKGRNFYMVITTVGEYRNYDNSSFGDPSPLLEDDDAMAAIWEKCYPLQPIIAPDQFKSYEELKALLDKVLGHSGMIMRKPARVSTPAYEDGEEVRHVKTNRLVVDEDDDEDDEETSNLLAKLTK